MYKTMNFRWFNPSATRQIVVEDFSMPKFAVFAYNHEVWYSLTEVDPEGKVVAIHASQVYFVE